MSDQDAERIMGYHHDKDTAKEVCEVLNADKARKGATMSRDAITKITRGTRGGHRFQITEFSHGAETVACWGSDWGMDADGPHKWTCCCTTHGHPMEVRTYSEAVRASGEPSMWCEGCQDAQAT